MTETTSQTYPKGTLVLIKDLQSEAGKKLNGSHGIIQSELVQTGDGTCRYPVVMYASLNDKTGQAEILPSPDKKAIKAQNLELNLEPNYSKLLELASWKYLEGKTVHHPKSGRERDETIYFWMAQYHRVRPDDFFVGSQYATMLWAMDKKVKEALDIAKTYLNTYPADHETFPIFFKDLCSMVAEARETDILEQLLELAIKSQKDVTLKRLEETCMKLIQTSPDLDNPAISNVHVRACKELVKLNGEGCCVMALAKAYGKAGDYMESARCYRRLLAMDDELADAGLAAVKGYLVLTQLQCPGQPLEDKFVVQVKGGYAYVINLSDRDKVEKETSETGEIQLRFKGEVRVTMVPLPSDPDDTAEFPVSLLEQLSP